MEIFDSEGRMSRGFAMMFKSLVGMLGFQPDVAAEGVNNFKLYMEDKIKSFDGRLTRIEMRQDDMQAQLQSIIGMQAQILDLLTEKESDHV